MLWHSTCVVFLLENVFSNLTRRCWQACVPDAHTRLAWVGHVPGLLSVCEGSGDTGHFTFCSGELVLGQEFWLFPARLVIYLNLPCYSLEKRGNELNGDFVLLSSENTGAMEFIISYRITGQPGVEVVGGSIWALGGCVGSHVWGLLLPMSPWAMSEAQALSSVDQWPFPSVMTLVSRHVALWRALIWGECPASFPVWEPVGTWCDRVVWPGSCPSLKLDTYSNGHHVVCRGAESRW